MKVCSEAIPFDPQEPTATEARAADPQKPTTLRVITPAARTATRLLLEKKLVGWAKKRNLEQGIAPASATAAKEAARIGCLKQPTTRPSKFKIVKQWLRRWRRR